MNDPAELLDCAPDERLLAEDMSALPPAEQREAPVPAFRARRPLVAAGVTLTAATLLGGIALVAFAIVRSLTDAFDGTTGAAIGVGVLLIATHWGWIHVAEAGANALAARRRRAFRASRAGWLAAIKPYTRYSVSTRALDDGSIRIVRTRHRPVRTGPRTFSFVREDELTEIVGGDAPAAEIAERAELLRRAAALDTDRERRRFGVAADAYESAMLGRDDDEQRAVARRAAAQALSERINTNLRDPPLVE